MRLMHNSNSMKILVERKWKKETYTIGNLYINGVKFCNTCEDKDRHLTQNMPLSKIREVKIADVTAIPTGTYKIRMDVVSPKYSLKPWYYSNCHGGRLPRLENVPGFSGVLIHCGNTAKDSSGCILVGKNDVVGMVTNSKAIFQQLYDKMYSAYKRGENIEITIK